MFSGHSHSFDVGIAKNLGLNAAIVFNHIVYWLRINSSKENNIIDGQVWMYETQQDIAKCLDYLTVEEVKKSIVKLLDSGLLIKENFNKNPFDKTNWYTTSDQSIIQKTLTKEPHGAIGNAIGRNRRIPTAPCIYDQKEQHKDKEPPLPPLEKKPHSDPNSNKEQGGGSFKEEWKFLSEVDISRNDKQRLIDAYSSEIVKKIIELVMAPDFVIKKDLSSAIFHFARNPDQLPKENPEIKQEEHMIDEGVIAQNQEDAIKFADENINSPEAPHISFGGGHIEFRHLRGFKILFNDNNFANKFDESIKSYRAYLSKIEKSKKT